jgi:hypothetical protein
VVNVDWGGAAVAGEATLDVIVPSVIVSVKPGARLPVKVSAAAVSAPLVFRYVPAVLVAGVNAKLAGANIVIDVIAYAFVIGFAILRVVPAVATPVM